MNLAALFKLLSDAANDLSDAETGFALVKAIIADIKAGTMPTISPQDLALVEKLVGDGEKLAVDIKALGA